MKRTNPFAIVAALVIALIPITGTCCYADDDPLTIVIGDAKENIEALTDNEVPYNQPVWERYYRNDLEYNCSRPGGETC